MILADGKSSIVASLKWEYIRWKKECIKHLLWPVCIMIVLTLGYLIEKSVFIRVETAIFKIPQEFYAFFGLYPKAETDNFMFFINVVYLYLNVYILWKSCKTMVDIVRIDEVNNNIYSMCGQWMTKKQFIMRKMMWGLLSSAVVYILWYLSYLVMVFIGSKKDLVETVNVGQLIEKMFLGILILLFLQSIAFFASVYSYKNREAVVSTWVSGCFWTGVIVANMYKIFDVLIWFFNNLPQKKEIQVIIDVGKELISPLEKASSFTEMLRILSPFSWFNSWSPEGEGPFFLRISICIIFSVALFTISIKKYQKLSF